VKRLLVLLLALVVTACGSGEEESGNIMTDVRSRPVTHSEVLAYIGEFGRALVDAGGSPKAVRRDSVGPLGSTKILTTDGSSAIPPSEQTQTLVQLTSPDGIPRSWVVSMSGTVQQPSQNPTQYFPFAKFQVQWGSAGSLFQTEVDGYSDQFLMVFGNQVIVSAALDLANARTMIAAIPSAQFPRSMALSASVARSDGAVVTACRSIVVPPSSSTPIIVSVPYAATGVIIRSPDSAWWSTGAGPTFTWQVAPAAGFGATIDVWDPPIVVNGHSSGQYLKVPSLANALQVSPPVGAVSPAFIEFLLEP
jgi:hypothetical protein